MPDNSARSICAGWGQGNVRNVSFGGGFNIGRRLIGAAVAGRPLAGVV